MPVVLPETEVDRLIEFTFKASTSRGCKSGPASSPWSATTGP